MSLIKEALDKAVEEDPDDTSVEESYRNIDEQHSQESAESSPQDDTNEVADTSDDLSMGTVLLVTFLVILSVVVIGQIVFIMTYFL